MVVKLNRPDIRYEVESLTRMLLGEAPVTVVLPGETPPRDDDHHRYRLGTAGWLPVPCGNPF